MADNLDAAADNLKQCPVCFEDMTQKQPKLLDCKHSFCKPCLAGLQLHGDSEEETLSCPTCKHSTVVPGGSLDRLPDNFLLSEVKVFLDKLSETQRGISCFYCSKQNKITSAKSLCISCERYLCEACLTRHNKNPRFKDHETKSLSATDEFWENCQSHGESVMFVCAECNPKRLLCDVCMITEDPCHDHENLMKYAEARDRALETLEKQLSRKSEIKTAVDEIRVAVDRQETSINAQMTLLVDAVKDSGKSMIKSVQENSNINNILPAADKYMEMCEMSCKENTIENGTLSSLERTISDLELALKTFEAEKDKTRLLKFTPGILENLGILAEESGIDQNVTPKKSIVTHVSRSKEDNITRKAQPISSTTVELWSNKIQAGRYGSVFFIARDDKSVNEITSDGRVMWTVKTDTSSYCSQVHIDTIRDFLFIFQDFGGYKYFSKVKILPKSKALKITTCPGGKSCLDSLFNFCILDEETLLYMTHGAIHKFTYESERSLILKNDRSMLVDENLPTMVPVAGLIHNSDFAVIYPYLGLIELYDNFGQMRDTVRLEIEGKMSAIINEDGNFLVADSKTRKVSEVTSKGEYIRHVATGDNGLACPVGLAYSAPYLWVIDREDEKEALRCYRYPIIV